MHYRMKSYQLGGGISRPMVLQGFSSQSSSNGNIAQSKKENKGRVSMTEPGQLAGG